MRIGGLSGLQGISGMHGLAGSTLRPQSQQNLQKISDNLLAKRSEQYSRSKQAVNEFRRVAMLETICDVEASSLLDGMSEGLDEAEVMLREMHALAVTAADRNATAEERQEADEKMKEILQRLEDLIDDNELLNGSYGGQKGVAGVQNLGIDEITTSGNVQGKAKFYIEIVGGRVSITAKIGGETVTNVLTKGDRETTFKLQGGKSITLKFDKGIGNMISGVINGVQLQKGKAAVDLRDAVSADKEAKTRVTWDGRLLDMPRFVDLSAHALGLRNMDISTQAGAIKASRQIDGALSKTAVLRREVTELLSDLRRFLDPTEDDLDLYRSLTVQNVRELTGALTKSIGENPSESLSAQAGEDSDSLGFQTLLR